VKVALILRAAERGDRGDAFVRAGRRGREPALRMARCADVRRVDATVHGTRRIGVLLDHPAHPDDHRRWISLRDLRAVRRDDDESVRREMIEQHSVQARVRARPVAPRHDRMAEPGLAQIRRPKEREHRRRATVGADARGGTDVVLRRRRERAGHRGISRGPRAHRTRRRAPASARTGTTARASTRPGSAVRRSIPSSTAVSPRSPRTCGSARSDT